MSESWNVHAELASASRALQHELDIQHTLDRSALLSVELVPNCQYAGISIAHRDGTVDTPAATDDVVRRGDELQYELGEGPCLDAIWHHDTVVSKDLSNEPRWLKWAPQVATELNVHSMLCVQLFTSANVVGGLNLYSSDVDAFDGDDYDIATFLAAHVAVAVAESQHADQLRVGAVNRTLIGQAQGILMERFDVDGQQAFNVLRRVSQDNNIKLLRVAQELINTRRTPGS